MRYLWWWAKQQTPETQARVFLACCVVMAGAVMLIDIVRHL